jgi:hypothetical protein
LSASHGDHSHAAWAVSYSADALWRDTELIAEFFTPISFIDFLSM